MDTLWSLHIFGGQERKEGFQCRESDTVYETLVIYTLDKKIICRKLGLVGILNIYHLSFMFLRTTIFVKEINSKDIKRKDTFKNTILTTI